MKYLNNKLEKMIKIEDIDIKLISSIFINNLLDYINFLCYIITSLKNNEMADAKMEEF